MSEKKAFIKRAPSVTDKADELIRASQINTKVGQHLFTSNKLEEHERLARDAIYQNSVSHNGNPAKLTFAIPGNPLASSSDDDEVSEEEVEATWIHTHLPTKWSKTK